MSIRDTRTAARADLHEHMAVDALYIAATGEDPVACTVRTWLKGDGVGGDTEPAELAITEDRIRFTLGDFTHALRHKAIVSVAAGEAYRIDHLYPVDGDYQTARVTRLSATEADGLEVPE